VPNFTNIATGLDVAPALAELAVLPDYCWLENNTGAGTNLSMLDYAGTPIMREELPETWRLIDEALAILSADHGDAGRLIYCRVGRMPPGVGLPPHFDGIDGVVERRYQLALQSAPGVALTVGDEMRCPRPGDLWRIAAHRTHSVWNHSPIDRVTLLFDTRVDAAPHAAA
jgi:hypothetical protein